MPARSPDTTGADEVAPPALGVPPAGVPARAGVETAAAGVPAPPAPEVGALVAVARLLVPLLLLPPQAARKAAAPADSTAPACRKRRRPTSRLLCRRQ